MILIQVIFATDLMRCYRHFITIIVSDCVSTSISAKLGRVEAKNAYKAVMVKTA